MLAMGGALANALCAGSLGTILARAVAKAHWQHLHRCPLMSKGRPLLVGTLLCACACACACACGCVCLCAPERDV